MTTASNTCNPQHKPLHDTLTKDISEVLQAMHRGAARAVRPRRLPPICIGFRSLRRSPDDKMDPSRFTKTITLASSLIDDAVSSAVEELYRNPDEFLKNTSSTRNEEAFRRGQKHAWRLLDALKRANEVRMDASTNGENDNDSPLTSLTDDVTLKLSSYDPILQRASYRSASRPDWARAHKYEDELIDLLDRKRAGLNDMGPQMTRFERAVQLLGTASADFMAGYEVSRDAGGDMPASPADRKRYSRLRKKLGHGISPTA